MSRYATLFPGQGSQYVGMGRDAFETHPQARSVFERADQALGFPLSRLSFEGPEAELTLTINAQPAILTYSTAVYEILAQAGLLPAFGAGHSLGEYSALVAAQALSFEDALHLVRIRGELMQATVAVGEGAMAAIVDLSPTVVEELCGQAAQSEVCSVANYNSPRQVVVAGARSAVERAAEIARARGARRVQMLQVSAPFHCVMMQPAEERLAPILDGIEFKDPRFPVVCNLNAEPIRSGEEARSALKLQVSRPVRWEQSMRRLLDEGTQAFIEVGPGKTLTGLVRHLEKGATVFSTDGLKQLEKTSLLLANPGSDEPGEARQPLGASR